MISRQSCHPENERRGDGLNEGGEGIEDGIEVADVVRNEKVVSQPLRVSRKREM